MGRDRLLSGPQGRGDPARGPHHLDRRRVRCANVGAPLQEGLACRGRGQADSARGGHEFRSRAGPKVRRPSAADPGDTRAVLGRAASWTCPAGYLMNIAKRLVLLLAVPLLAFLVIGGILDLQLHTIEDHGKYVAGLQLPSVAVIGNITRKHAELRVDLRDYLLAPGDQERAKALAAFRANEVELNRLLDQYADTLISDERDRRLMGDFRAMSEQWIAEANKLIALVAGGQRQEALDRIFVTLPALGERSHKVSGEWAEHNEQLAREASRSTINATSDARTKWWVANVLAVMITIALG